MVLGSVAVAIAYGAAWLPGGAPPWANWLMVLGLAALLPGTMLLGAVRPGQPHRLLVASACFLAIVLVVGFGAALLLPPETATGPLLLGLPLRAAVVIYGIGLLPILVLPLVFAATFRTSRLDDAALDALRRECAQARDDEGGAP